ncbi:hypothetical protein GGI04_004729, partial [Coemansia thaxteri]
MTRQVERYLLAYPELSMRRCSKEHKGTEQETMEHMQMCASGDTWPKRQEGRTTVDVWIWDHASERTSFVGIGTADWARASETLARGLQASAQGRVMEARTRQLVQRAYQQRLGYVRERWWHRSESQIGREEDSRILQSKRRRLMRIEQPVLKGEDDGVPGWSRTMPP